MKRNKKRIKMDITTFFDACELLCPHVAKKFGAKGLRFMDTTILDNLTWIRSRIGRPIRVNNWQNCGKLSQRGLRCNCCALVAAKTKAATPYLSAHVLGKAVDFDVDGMTAEAVRKWIKEQGVDLPYPCRLEEGVSWVHMDTVTDGAAGWVTTFRG